MCVELPNYRVLVYYYIVRHTPGCGVSGGGWTFNHEKQRPPRRLCPVKRLRAHPSSPPDRILTTPQPHVPPTAIKTDALRAALTPPLPNNAVSRETVAKYRHFSACLVYCLPSNFPPFYFFRLKAADGGRIADNNATPHTRRRIRAYPNAGPKLVCRSDLIGKQKNTEIYIQHYSN